MVTTVADYERRAADLTLNVISEHRWDILKADAAGG